MAIFEPGELAYGRFEIVRRLGKGGMGVVYLAYDRKKRRQVALKTVLAKYVAEPHARQRFIREVKTTVQFDHPGIVKVFEAREHENQLYYTMEYVEGVSLRKMLSARGKFGLGSTTRIICLLCDALQHAHNYTVHRDLSPENVLILENGNVKLLDFGLAMNQNSKNPLTREGMNIGKMQYCAPEQQADASTVDLRADLYSVGVMYYELLSGRLPLSARPLTQRVPGLPAECDALVMKAMAEDPNDRFQSAQAMRDEVERIYKLPHPTETETAPVDQPSPLERLSSEDDLF